jgi:xanthine dehydrogenase accessory factor
MKEIKAIVDAYESLDFLHHQASLATVVRVEGSSYRRTGARMLVLDDGHYLGGISGGCLEGDALRRAQKAIASDKPSLVTYDTTQGDGQQIGVGLGCNGIIDVLFTPLRREGADNPVKILSSVASTRIPRIVITVTNCPELTGSLGKTWIYEEEGQFREAFHFKTILAELLKDIDTAREDQISKTISYNMGADAITLFIEVIHPAIHLVLYAGNYDMYPIVRMAGELGWHITVVTNTAGLDKSLFMLATKVLHAKGEEQPVIDPYSAILLMTHDYKTDFKILQTALSTAAGYIGLLGPRKRGLKMFEELVSEGKSIAETDVQRIYAPAGLDIGANSPEEIALSILAEITAHFAGRKGQSLRLRERTIHEN